MDFFPDSSTSTSLDKLTIYLSGKYKLATSQAGHSLKWWKVCVFNSRFILIPITLTEALTVIQDHDHEFPVLLSLAKDFLACCSTSASVEWCFSAAADICGQDQGKLAARTIEQCVSLHQWLQQGFKADGDFELAQSVVSQVIKDIQEKKPKLAVITAIADQNPSGFLLQILKVGFATFQFPCYYFHCPLPIGCSLPASLVICHSPQ
jgi:hypothetical protein